MTGDFLDTPKRDRLRFERSSDGDTLHMRGCENCGEPGRDHTKERVRDESGRFYYHYRCQE